MSTIKIVFFILALHFSFPLNIAETSIQKVFQFPFSNIDVQDDDHIFNFNYFFQSLKELEQSTNDQKVRILQFGDSHTACDWFTGALRNSFTKDFGNGGTGFIYAVKPWKWHFHNLVDYQIKTSFDPIAITKSKTKSMRLFILRFLSMDLWSFIPDSYHEHIETRRALKYSSRRDYTFGLGGVYSYINHSNITIRAKHPFNHIELWYNTQIAGPKISLSLYPGKMTKTINSKADTKEIKREIISGPHYYNQLKYTIDDLTGAELSGFIFESKNSGVVLDRLGLDGSKISYLFHQDWLGTLKNHIQWRNANLIILAYGTNSALAKYFNPSEYYYQLDSIINRIRQISKADILLLSPPDLNLYDESKGIYYTPSRLKEIISIQKRIAKSKKVSLIDLQKLMGGDGSIDLYYSRGLAQKDHVHLNLKGYRYLAEKVYSTLIKQYQEYKKNE